jgi:hypothetical protein
VKATFFTIGRMAQAFPEGVRKLVEAGHSVGSHSQNHPVRMDRLPIERAKGEIDQGIASVKAALGDDAKLAPFFRIPGLRRVQAIEDYLASQGIQTWSADFPADDWRHISSSRVYELAMKRLEDKGKGILLLHDIQARTVAALPRILLELKARGFRIVHVVPATSQNPATPTEPQEWQLHPISESVATSRWPKIPNFVFADNGSLPAPALSDMGGVDKSLRPARDRGGAPWRGVPLMRQMLWPAPSSSRAQGAATALSAPSLSVFEISEGLRALTTQPTRRAERTSMARAVMSAASGQVIQHKPQAAGGRHAVGHGARAHVSRRMPKSGGVQEKKRVSG